MMTPKQFRERRIALGLSVEEVASALHVDTLDLIDWEHGEATGSRFDHAADAIFRGAEVERLDAIAARRVR